jgi:hypothetical protein
MASLRACITAAIGLGMLLLCGAPASAQEQRAGATPPPSGSSEEQGKAADEPKPPSVTGGYSWSEKPRARKRVRRRVRYDPNAPNVTFPGFRLLPDGSSLIWVVVNQTVPVEERRAKGRVTYILKGAVIRIRNNTNPLVTTHFNTPVSRLRLVRDAAGAQLVIHLREDVSPTHRVVRGPRGLMVLQVRVPRATRTHAQAGQVTPLAVGRPLPGRLPKSGADSGHADPKQ